MFTAEPPLQELARYFGKNLAKLKIQLLPDLIVGFLFNDELGFVCEFGAADGATLGNTFLLEELGLDGILVEPSVRCHELLSQNRKCKISQNAFTQ